MQTYVAVDDVWVNAKVTIPARTDIDIFRYDAGARDFVGAGTFRTGKAKTTTSDYSVRVTRDPSQDGPTGKYVHVSSGELTDKYLKFSQVEVAPPAVDPTTDEQVKAAYDKGVKDGKSAIMDNLVAYDPPADLYVLGK